MIVPAGDQAYTVTGLYLCPYKTGNPREQNWLCFLDRKAYSRPVNQIYMSLLAYIYRRGQIAQSFPVAYHEQ